MSSPRMRGKPLVAPRDLTPRSAKLIALERIRISNSPGSGSGLGTVTVNHDLGPASLVDVHRFHSPTSLTGFTLGIVDCWLWYHTGHGYLGDPFQIGGSGCEPSCGGRDSGLRRWGRYLDAEGDHDTHPGNTDARGHQHSGSHASGNTYIGGTNPGYADTRDERTRRYAKRDGDTTTKDARPYS